MSGESISVIVELLEGEDDTKGFLGELATGAIKIPVDRLREQVKAETEKLQVIFGSIPAKAGWKLEEVEVGVEISAKGEVSFIGTVKAGASGTLKLKFRR